MRMKTWQKGLAGTLLLLLIAQASGLSAGLDRWLGDSHWRWAAARRSEPFPPQVVVIGIDDASIRQLGRLRNWSRSLYADLLDRLKLAKAVGLDVLFVDPDERDAAGDRAFTAAVKRHGRVVVAFNQWTVLRPLGQADLAAIKAFSVRLPQVPTQGWPLLQPQLLQPPLPDLVTNAAAFGTADVTADADGVYRQPLLLRSTLEQRLLPHLAVSLAALASGTPLEQVASTPRQLTFGDRQVPHRAGRVLLQPIAVAAGFGRKGGQPVTTISFAEALRAAPQQFAEKVVLVGETAVGTTDIRANPLDNGLRGVELNAEILANLLYLPAVQPLPAQWQWLALLAALAVPLTLFGRQSPKVATVGSLLALALLLGGLEAAFWLGRLLPSWAPVLVGCGGATLLMGLQRLAEENRAKEQVRQSFSLYVSPEVVNEIVNDPQQAHQEGRRQQTAVLFSDIRSFTTFCEQNPPEQVVQQMRTYLGSMADSVTAHRGVLDKFIGDAVMALWGPFLEPDMNPGALAVVCGLDMLDRLDGLNAEWAAAGLPTLKIGIGVHFGDAIVGNIGSDSRMQYTALGDAVNLASRLESNTKELKATFVVSRELRDAAAPALGAAVTFRPVATIQVRNRNTPVEVFEVLRPVTTQEESHHAT
ncbi:MAG: adenylate/guanylate cyclase domain-containing protein [Fimbriimonadaceae bacterium]|nr:adenylate/guanylate cyclase domain-containing protein [Fimbriimonadaceae bacterium]